MRSKDGSIRCQAEAKVFLGFKSLIYNKPSFFIFPFYFSIVLTILPFIAIIVAGVYYAITRNKLTVTAAVTGAITATLVFAGAGYVGFVMMTLFFLLGTLATGHKMNVKKQIGIAEENKGRRTASQVLANAGVQGLLGLLMVVDVQHQPLYLLMIAAGFSSATADTLSSELGSVYGTRFYNIINFKKDLRGLNGVVSLEGTLAGFAGSCIIALLYAIAAGFAKGFIIVIIAGTAGNLFDSVLGATLERKGLLKNDGVNLLNTAFAAVVAWAMF